MTKEEKELLLKDLCARLPYGIMVDYPVSLEKRDIARLTGISEDGLVTLDIKFDVPAFDIQKDNLMPYLRPMSSMTEEEYNCFVKILGRSMVCRKCYDWHEQWIQSPSVEEYLNEHLFDYRGLLPNGLALEAQEGMYEF